MRRRGWVSSAPVRSLLASALGMIVASFPTAHAQGPAMGGMGGPESGKAKRLVGRAQEPMAAVASLSRSAGYLDDIAVNWTRDHDCGSCHTNYPYMVARPLINAGSNDGLLEVREFFEDRVTHWDDKDKSSKPRWDAEVISTATALAFNDAVTTGKLHPLTRQALDRVWTLQKPGGGFEWLKCGWPPLEHDDYYGAIVAALGVGVAPGDYQKAPNAQAGVGKLKQYFAKHPAPDLHHRTMLMWASMRVDGLMTAEQRAETIQKLRDLQRSDGGWNLPSLGTWKRGDGTSNDPNAPSDGYATGFIVYVMRQAGVPAEDPALRRGAGWLLMNQRVSGGWFTRSLTNDKHHYIAHAGSSFAIMALDACGMIPSGWQHSKSPIRSALRSRGEDE
jgi:squalene-hopene/tetraprenyl-beta-curcumene cyclase